MVVRIPIAESKEPLPAMPTPPKDDAASSIFVTLLVATLLVVCCFVKLIFSTLPRTLPSPSNHGVSSVKKGNAPQSTPRSHSSTDIGDGGPSASFRCCALVLMGFIGSGVSR